MGVVSDGHEFTRGFILKFQESTREFILKFQVCRGWVSIGVKNGEPEGIGNQNAFSPQPN